MRRCRGMISVSTLISIYILASCIPLVAIAYRLLSDVKYDASFSQNEISLCQLRRVLLISYDLRIDKDSLAFVYHNDNYRLHLINGNLILQPGTQIILSDVDDISFYTSGNSLAMRYVIKGEEYERIIGSKESFHVKDLSDDPDECSGDDSADM